MCAEGMGGNVVNIVLLTILIVQLFGELIRRPGLFIVYSANVMALFFINSCWRFLPKVFITPCIEHNVISWTYSVTGFYRKVQVGGEANLPQTQGEWLDKRQRGGWLGPGKVTLGGLDGTLSLYEFCGNWGGTLLAQCGGSVLCLKKLGVDGSYTTVACVGKVITPFAPQELCGNSGGTQWLSAGGQSLVPED